MCSGAFSAYTTLACHADAWRAIGPPALFLYVPLLIPVGLALCAIGYAFERKPRRAAWRYDRTYRGGR